jgi:RHS repeat-associated protein
MKGTTNIRRAAGLVIALGLLALSVRAQDYPLWQNSSLDLTLPDGGNIASSGGGMTMQGDGSLSGPALGMQFAAAMILVPQSIDAEVAALAAALGDGQAISGESEGAKALRIFNWVRNNISYEHYHGLVKGSALTLLEGSGNDFDQCALLRDLLVAAGYSSSSVKLVRLANWVKYDDLRDWMGLADEPFPGKTHTEAFGIPSPYGAGLNDKAAKRLSFARVFLNGLGSGTAANGGFPAYDPNDPSSYLLFDRVFVGITLDGGASYQVMDPSFKKYVKGAGGNLVAASGYSRSALLAAAAGTADSNSIYGMNTNATGNYLTARVAALMSTFGSTGLKDLVQGRSIVPVEVSTLSEAWQQSLYYSGLSPAFYDSVDAPDFAVYKAKVRFSSTVASGLDYELPTADLKGRKITLTFSGSTAELRMDDDTLADTGTLGSATSMDLTISVTHPGGSVGNQAETKNYLKQTSAGEACSYAIIYGFDASERLLAKRQEQLKAYKDAGKADDSREVRTEVLNIMGLTWLYQTSLAHHLLASQNRIIPVYHHRFGRMAQEAGFYVDVGLQFSDDRSDDGIADGRFDNAFHLGSLFASAMEHGVIQQMQVKADGLPYDAVSTVNILRTANGGASGQKLFLARATNWATIKPLLTGTAYTSGNGAPDLGEFTDTNNNGVRDPGEAWTDQPVKNNLEWLINNKSAQLFLPLNGNVVQGNWTGTGWVIRAPTIAGMIISGGYSGGYSTSVGTVKSPVITTGFSYSPVSTYKSTTVPAISYTPAVTTPKYYSSDPVDMTTGAFTYASEDMVTGTEGAPRGLAFSRHYASNLSTRDEQNIGYGWTHNLHIRAEARTASDEALGMGSPQQAAAFLAAVTAASDLYRTDATPKEWGVATLAVGWFVDQMRNNAVSVRMGKDIYQFLLQPDGTYTAPPGSTMSLTKVSGAYQLKQRLGNSINFDTSGRAANITDVDGKAMTFNYNTNGTLNYVEDCYTRRYTFAYNGTHITGITDSTSPSRSVSFGYDTVNWNLTSATDPEGKVSYFDYSVSGDPGSTTAGEHRIVRLRNHDGETITQNVWDSLGRVERQFLHGDTNKTFRLYYTGRDNFEVNPQGGVTHYYYDERGRASGSRDAEGNLSTIGYDGQDRVISRTSGANETTVYHYDNASNLTQIDHPRGGGSTIMAYDSLNRLDLVTDPNGVQTDYVYFASGNDAGKDRPQSVIHAKGTTEQSSTTHAYWQSGAAAGRAQTITDGDGLVTQKTYDSYGQPDVTTAPGGFATDQNYDARGNLTALTDPRGKTTSYTYNLRRQVTSTVADAGGIAAAANSSYDNQARTATVTAPAHNGAQRPQASTTYSPTDKVRLDKLNGVTVADTTYDSRDWAASAADAANRATTFVRKANGDLQEAQRPASRTTSFAYDGDHRLTQTTNPGANSGSRVEGFVYDTTSGGLPRTVKTEADGLNVVREFDAKGQLRFLKDRKGATFEFRYDPLGRRTHVIAPGGAATVTSYTKNGRVASVTEPSGDTAAFSYSSSTGRLQSVAYSGGATVNYTSYDASGNLLALNENGTNAITRAYDGLNRVTSYTEGGNTIGYRYYPSGKLAKLIYPGGTENGVGHVEYLYNAEGRLWQVIDRLDSTASPRVTTYSWNADGRLASVTRPNGTVRTISYDSAGRPSAIGESAGAMSLLAFGISYYPSDEIKTLDVTPAAPIRKTKVIPAVAMTFDSANRVATFAGQAVSHDADGNITSGPLPATGAMASYAYDSRNRLTSAGGLTYAYNAEGNRVGITSPTETTTLVVDANNALPRVLVRTKNGVTTRYVYGAGLQYEVGSTGVTIYYHYDQSGNTAMLTDASGAVVDRLGYSAYGEIRYRLANFDTPFLYGGFFGVMTDANGLIAMRARYYNPLTKRFLTSDPALDGLNWYAYADGNPINFSDPTGFGSTKSLNSGATSIGFAPLANPLIGNNSISSFGGGQNPYNGHTESEAVAATVMGLYEVTKVALPVILTEGLGMPASVVTAVRVERAVAWGAAKTAETIPGRLYHYTGAGNAESILQNGLGAGGRRTFATPAASLSPVQAQIELALPANRGYPGALFEIDTVRLQQLGINPAVGSQRIMSTPNAGGGGTEYIFSQPIPPSAIRQIPFP